MPENNTPTTTGNNALKTILDDVDTAITDPNTGILKKITELMEAGEADKSKAIVNLIGSVIGLVIKCIKAAV